MNNKFKLRNIKILDFNNIQKSILLKTENYLYDNNPAIFEEKELLYKNKIYKKFLYNFIWCEFLELIKQMQYGQKIIIVINPHLRIPQDDLEDSNYQNTYFIMIKYIKKIQSLIPIYFYFSDKQISLDNIDNITDLVEIKDIYYLLLEISSKLKKVQIKLVKKYLEKNGLVYVLKQYFDNPNKILSFKGIN